MYLNMAMYISDQLIQVNQFALKYILMTDPLPQDILNDDEDESDSSSTLSSFSSVSTTRDALEDLDLHLPKTRTFTFSQYTFQEIVPSSDIKPKPRSGHRIVHYKGRIYSFGGYNPLIDGNDPDMEADQFWAQSKPLFKELWELNLSTRKWTKCVMRGEARVNILPKSPFFLRQEKNKNF